MMPRSLSRSGQRRRFRVFLICARGHREADINTTNWFRLAVLPVFAFAALFAALSIDVSARLIAGAGHQETGNLVLLLFFELTRAFRVLVGLALVVLVLARAPLNEAMRALVLFLLCGVIFYAIAFSGGGYVGPFQEWLTRTLRGAGLGRTALFVIFGYAPWAAWLSLGGLLRFSLLFPKPLTPGTVEQSGNIDRAGMLRSVPGAGLDVGAQFRKLAALAMRNGLLRTAPVWIFAIAGAALSIALRTASFRWVLWLPYLVGVAIAITCFRTSFETGDEDARHRLRWIGRGALAAFGFFIAAGLAGLRSGPLGSVGVFVLMTLAPGSLLLGLGLGVLQRRRRLKMAPEGS